MSEEEKVERKKVTLPEVQRKKEMGEPITMLTAYDVSIARAVDQAGIDMILVGDSYGMVVLGYDTTVPVTMDQMITAAQAVARGPGNALALVGIEGQADQWLFHEGKLNHIGRAGTSIP